LAPICVHAQEANLKSVAPLANMAPWICQGPLRSRNIHFRAQREAFEHSEQPLVDHGQTNHQHTSRRLC
jgi:hypothetical protein